MLYLKCLFAVIPRPVVLHRGSNDARDTGVGGFDDDVVASFVGQNSSFFGLWRRR